MHRALELARDREAVDRPVVHRRLEELDAALPLAFAVYIARSALRSSSSGVVAGPVRVAMPIARGRARSRAVDDDRFVQRRRGRARRRRRRIAGRRSVLEQHRELVAAEAGGGVAGAQAAPEPVGHDAEQLVAGAVAEAVVHGLEVVEVDEGTAGMCDVGAPHRALERVLDTVE